MARILIADHDPDTMQIFAETLRERGHEVALTRSGEEALGVLRARGAEIFLVDTDLPITDGFAVMKLVFQESIKTTLVAVVGPGEFGKGKRAMAEGAFHFLCRPLVLTELSQIIEKAVAVERMKRRLCRLGIMFLHDYHRIGDLGIGIRLWSGMDANAMILCENGGGGSELAELMHLSGPRKSRPFLRADCRRGGTAFEREMYGFSRGAFLGADADRVGLVEEARGGTIYLDHFESLDPAAFEGLSRLVLESKYVRVGDEGTRTSNVRLICCGTPDAPENRRGVSQKLFNALAAMKITIPRLRDCQDLPRIAADLISNKGLQGISAPRPLSAEDARIIGSHDWPGNIRELDLAIDLWALVGEWRLGQTVSVIVEKPAAADGPSEAAAVETGYAQGPADKMPVAPGTGLGPDGHCPERTVSAPDPGEGLGSLSLDGVGISPNMDYTTARDLFEAAFIDFKLKQFGGNVTTTAREVGLGRRTLQEKMKKVGIDSQKYREE